MTGTASPASATSRAVEQARVKVWDLPLRVFHWTLVLAIAVAFLSGEEGSPLNQWHIMAGWVAGVLIVFRIVWGFLGGEHSRFGDFIKPSRIPDHIHGLLHRNAERTLGHNPLGGVSVVVLLILIAGTVWTGAFGGEAAQDLHELIAWTLLAFIGLHVVAVIVMSLLERENLVRAMIIGSKPVRAHPGAVDARMPRPLAIAVATLVVAGTVYGILQYDPQAFTRRSVEGFEHRGTSARPALPASQQEDADRDE